MANHNSFCAYKMEIIDEFRQSVLIRTRLFLFILFEICVVTPFLLLVAERSTMKTQFQRIHDFRNQNGFTFYSQLTSCNDFLFYVTEFGRDASFINKRCLSPIGSNAFCNHLKLILDFVSSMLL